MGNMSNSRRRGLYFGLAFTVAALAALIIYIIVDKTTNEDSCPKSDETLCRPPILPENAAGAFNGSEGAIVCLPGYAFADGNTTRTITCTKPSTWDLETLPECVQITNPPLALKCPIQRADDSNLMGEVLFVRRKDAVQVEGRVEGLNSSSIQLINVNNHTELCYITKQPVPSVTSTKMNSDGLDITGTTASFDLVLRQPLKMNETFGFYIRAIGSKRDMTTRSSKFDGIFLFIVEQEGRTVGVFSADEIY